MYLYIYTPFLYCHCCFLKQDMALQSWTNKVWLEERERERILIDEIRADLGGSWRCKCPVVVSLLLWTCTDHATAAWLLRDLLTGRDFSFIPAVGVLSSVWQKQPSKNRSCLTDSCDVLNEGGEPECDRDTDKPQLIDSLRFYSTAVFENWLPSKCVGCSGNQHSYQCLRPGVHIRLAASCGERTYELTMEEKLIFFAQWITQVLELFEVVMLQSLNLLHHQIQLCSSVPPLDDVLADHHDLCSLPGIKKPFPVWWNM